MKSLIHFWNDESGASAAEYALILAIIGAAIAVAAMTLGTSIGGAMNDAATCINGGTAESCEALGAGGGGDEEPPTNETE